MLEQDLAWTVIAVIRTFHHGKLNLCDIYMSSFKLHPLKWSCVCRFVGECIKSISNSFSPAVLLCFHPLLPSPLLVSLLPLRQRPGEQKLHFVFKHWQHDRLRLGANYIYLSNLFAGKLKQQADIGLRPPEVISYHKMSPEPASRIMLKCSTFELPL